MRTTASHPRHRSGRLLAALVPILALVAASCGGDDDDSASTSRSTTTTEATEESTTTTAEVTSTTAALQAATTTTAKPITAGGLKAAPKAAPAQSAGIINVTAAPSTTAPPQVKRGGTIVYTTNADSPTGFDSLNGCCSAQQRAIYDELIDVDIDTGQIIPRLAESMTSTDGRTWTVKIRPNVKFHDGEPFDAAAVKFNWDRMSDPKNLSTAIGNFANVASTSVVDPLTVQLVLKTPNGQFPRTLAAISAIGSPKAIREKGADFATSPVGAGPFVFKSWKRDDRLELERNPNYWDTGKPYADRVTVKIIPEVTQRLNSLRTEDSNLSVIQDPETFDRAEKDASLTTYKTVSAIGGRFIIFNLAKAPFNDLLARKAIGHALDRAGFIRTVTKGLDDATEHIIRPPSPFYTPDVKQTPFDATLAQKALDDYAAKTGGPLTFTLKPTGTNQAMGEYFQAQVQQFKNLKMDVEVIPTTNLGTTFQRGDFQAVVSQIFSPDPDVYYSNLHSSSAANWGKFNSPEMDKALDAGRAGFDVQSRVAAYKKMQEVVRDEVPGIFVSQNKAGLVGAKYMRGIKGWAAAGFPAPNWQDVWLDK